MSQLTMGEILIGTCGYDYLDWRGSLYPQALKRDQFLAFYAGVFPVLELNFTYYQMPRAEQLAAMAVRAGPGLQFSVKANDALTHKIDPSAWQEAGKRFRDALAGLSAGGQLGAVLFQFPFSFHYTPDNRRYLDRLLKSFEGVPAVIEFRNAEWLGDQVMASLRERRVGFSCTDLPDLAGLPPAGNTVTAPLAYVRFHGRNSQDWWQGDAGSRYDYCYSEQELLPWAERIVGMNRQTSRVMVFFNNHRKGQAVLNARLLRKLIDDLEIPTKVLPGGS